jgi:hypothetical protein
MLSRMNPVGEQTAASAVPDGTQANSASVPSETANLCREKLSAITIPSLFAAPHWLAGIRA